MRRIRKIFQPAYKRSFAQCGEDLIAEFALRYCLGIKHPTYLDLGAHHPTYLNNTYLFYLSGSSGVCVEPDPYLFQQIQRKRPRDLCLNVGVGSIGRETAPFYILTNQTLSTFSKQEADRYQAYGSYKIEKVIQVPLFAINQILETNFHSYPDFISLDIEGLDLDVLTSLDFQRFGTPVICVETLTYTENHSEQKRKDIIELMIGNGYFIYADTYINTIFIKQETWDRRP